MTGQTPAQQQAALLAALAGHLRDHPNLAPVSISIPGDLHVWGNSSDPREEAARLVAWFRSLGVTELRARLFLGDAERVGYAAVHAYNVPLGEHTVPQVWGTVDGLQRHLIQGGMGNWREGLRLTVADLEHFAGHGTLPEAVQP